MKRNLVRCFQYEKEQEQDRQLFPSEVASSRSSPIHGSAEFQLASSWGQRKVNLLKSLEKIPDYLYPLPERQDGRSIFFKRAYDMRYAECVKKYGVGGAQMHCWRLIIWREICHIAFALLFVATLHVFIIGLSVYLALIMSAVFIAYFAYQEFVYQRKAEHLKQILFKATLDFTAWALPVIAYWLVFLI